VPTERLAKTVGATREQILKMGRAMGLADPPEISADQQRRSYITVIRRNWHLLPYEQLLQVLDWTPDQLAFTLREDDFLYIKLGMLKPKCEPLKYAEPDEKARAREAEITKIISEEFPKSDFPLGVGGATSDPLFSFVKKLSKPLPEDYDRLKEKYYGMRRDDPRKNVFSPRFCSSYFALYGDPLLDETADPYPDGYLDRLSRCGVDGVWLQGVLYKLAPFPWDPKLSEHYQERLEHLRTLVARAKKHEMKVYLYLNEPRAMPVAFFDQHPELKGSTEFDHAAMCTSTPEVQKFITDSVASICKAVPDLGGFFTITASENFTNCWSHHQGAGCPRCGKRTASEVIAEVNTLVAKGIEQANSSATLFAWDWGWKNEWADDAINRLPQNCALMSVSEWDLPIERGGIKSKVGEYSISSIGPGPRALHNWEVARKRGLKTIAKIQAGTTWEMGSLPYVPATDNVRKHVAGIRKANVDGLMLGWTLGGYPSPNLYAVQQVAMAGEKELDEILTDKRDPLSLAFSEYPYDGAVVYNAPVQQGPSNLLWAEPTGYKSTMVGIPYDDLDGWRGIYPSPVFVQQLEKVAEGFEFDAQKTIDHRRELQGHIDGYGYDYDFERALLIRASVAAYMRSVANQATFIRLRNSIALAKSRDEVAPLIEDLQQRLGSELHLAKSLYQFQTRESTIGFESTNQYFYIPIDLAEKVLNCRDLLDRWLPEQRAKFGIK